MTLIEEGSLVLPTFKTSLMDIFHKGNAKEKFLDLLLKEPPERQKEILDGLKKKVIYVGVSLLNELVRLNVQVLADARKTVLIEHEKRNQLRKKFMGDPEIYKMQQDINEIEDKISKMKKRYQAPNASPELKSQLEEVISMLEKEMNEKELELKNYKLLHYNFIFLEPLSVNVLRIEKNLVFASFNFIYNLGFVNSHNFYKIQENNVVKDFIFYIQKIYKPMILINYYFQYIMKEAEDSPDFNVNDLPQYLDDLKKVLIEGGATIEGVTEGGMVCIHCELLT